MTTSSKDSVSLADGSRRERQGAIPRATAVRSVTVGVSSLEEALALFVDTMGFGEAARHPMTPSLASAWGLADGRSAELVELAYHGYPMGRVRLARFTPVGSEKVRLDHGPNAPDSPTDVGPKALDFYVRPPIQRAMAMFEARGYAKRAEPVLHELGEIVSEELVYWGPDGVPMLLMVGHAHPPDQQRSPALEGDFSEVATLSIVSADRDRSRCFYRELLGLHCFEERESDPDFREGVSTLTGAPSGSQIHWEMYGDASEPSGKILLLHFFERTGKRLKNRMRPGNLGFSLITLEHPDLNELARKAQALSFEVVSAPAEVKVGERRERLMMLRGPNEEMIEVVEAPARPA